MRLPLFLTAAAAATVACAGAAASQAALPTYEDVGLAWAKMPSLKAMARLYPVRARALGQMRGEATVGCTADARGRLDCQVHRESPEGMMFGPAALNVMRGTSVRAVDGGTPQGRRFFYTLKFGNWRGDRLPLKYHPADAGLRWVERPELKDVWKMVGQRPGQVFSADFSCMARADGSLDCDLRQVTPNAARYASAALESMEKAKVRRADRGSPEGVRFDWTLRAASQSHCKGVRQPGAQSGATPVAGDDGSILGAMSEDTGMCVAQLVQLY